MTCHFRNCRDETTFYFMKCASRRVTSQATFCDEHARQSLEEFRASKVIGPGVASDVPGLVYLDFELSIYHEGNEEKPFCLYLHEIGGPRRFATMIDVCAWTALAGQFEQRRVPRPPTHSNWMASIRSLGGELQDVLIGAINKQDGWYDAWLRILVGGEVVTVAVRPSDAYTLAAVTGSPIAIYEDALTLNADKPT